MEIYDSNPKSFSQSKRAQKYSDPKDKRKAHPNGQQLRKVVMSLIILKIHNNLHLRNM